MSERIDRQGSAGNISDPGGPLPHGRRPSEPRPSRSAGECGRFARQRRESRSRDVAIPKPGSAGASRAGGENRGFGKDSLMSFHLVLQAILCRFLNRRKASVAYEQKSSRLVCNSNGGERFCDSGRLLRGRHQGLKTQSGPTTGIILPATDSRKGDLLTAAPPDEAGFCFERSQVVVGGAP